MELICPDCRAPLQPVDRRSASCPQHGGVYEVLFDRDAEAIPAAPVQRVAEGRMCDAHPRQPAAAECATCNKGLCTVCSFEVNGRYFCSDCAVSGAVAPPPPPAAEAAASPPPPIRRSTPEGLKCAQHLESDAVAQCRTCASGVCATCDFVLHGGIHFCPTCVDNAGSEEIPAGRKKMAIAALIIAIVCTLIFVVIAAGAASQAFNDEDGQALVGCAFFLLVALSLAGTIIGAGARAKRFRNTAMIWIALVWNAAILTILVVAFLFGVIAS